jgi:DsbC/DsbD-like thiol-disulfide interchange protein
LEANVTEGVHFFWKDPGADGQAEIELPSKARTLPINFLPAPRTFQPIYQSEVSKK